MMILPIMGLLAALSMFAAIFFCIRWLVKNQWYSILSVIIAHAILGYLHRVGGLQWELSKSRLLLLMTLICSMLILLKLSVLIGNKKKKRTV